jgi:serine/threonine-protein kinase HipA
MEAGGSPGGARPKVVVGLHGDQIISGADILPDGYTGWIVKFHSGQDAIDDGRVEYAYSNMARVAGLEMPETRLFTTSEGDAFFGAARFDRKQNQRFHVHTFGNLIHSNFRVPECDYAQLLKTTRILTKNQTDVAAAFRLMVFNILAHNRDDHVKNFAFMLNDRKEWRLTPAYDLTFAHGPGGEHTMTVAGEGRQPDRAHIAHIAEGAGLGKRQAVKILDEVAAAVSDWIRFASEAGVHSDTAKKIHHTMWR